MEAGFEPRLSDSKAAILFLLIHPPHLVDAQTKAAHRKAGGVRSEGYSRAGPRTKGASSSSGFYGVSASPGDRVRGVPQEVPAFSTVPPSFQDQLPAALPSPCSPSCATASQNATLSPPGSLSSSCPQRRDSLGMTFPCSSDWFLFSLQSFIRLSPSHDSIKLPCTSLPTWSLQPPHSLAVHTRSSTRKHLYSSAPLPPPLTKTFRTSPHLLLTFVPRT